MGKKFAAAYDCHVVAREPQTFSRKKAGTDQAEKGAADKNRKSLVVDRQCGKSKKAPRHLRNPHPCPRDLKPLTMAIYAVHIGNADLHVVNISLDRLGWR